MTERFAGLEIKGLAAAIPSRRKAVSDFAERFGEETVDRFRTAVGIDAFRVAAPSQTTADLSVTAAEALRAAGRLKPDETDVLIFVTQTPDAVAPATSALLQARLGLPESLFALDINQGCSGFLCGLLTAAHFLLQPTVRNVLLLGGDTLSRLIDPNDRGAAMLFGDAGFAAVIGRSGESAHAWTFESATASSDAIAIPHGDVFRMAGTEVFNFTITRVPEQIKALLTSCGETGEDLDLLLLHQANGFIVRQIARMLRIPEEKVPLRMKERGNASGASLPLLMCDLKAEGIEGCREALLSAFGVGLTWISCRMRMDFDAFLPTLETDYDRIRNPR